MKFKNLGVEEHKLYCGDCREVLKELPAASVDMVMTSPPYWALRDYGIEPSVWGGSKDCEHEWNENKEVVKFSKSKWKEGDKIFSEKELHNYKQRGDSFCRKCGAWRGTLGLEPSFDLFIKHLCDIFDQVKRVLKKSGNLWVNLGDTYSSSPAGNKMDWSQKNGDGVYNRLYNRHTANRTQKVTQKSKDYGKIPSKCLCLVPFRFAIEMTSRGWILRNVIVWHKRNCMPSSARDRFTVDFEYLFFFSKSKKYFFEPQYESHLTKEKPRPLEIVREREFDYNTKYPEVRGFKTKSNIKQLQSPQRHGQNINYNPQGRNKRCVWTINTKPFSEAHFAVYPPELVEIPLKAGCPKQICKKCGKPREKIYEGKSEEAFNIRVRDVKEGRIKHSDREASDHEILKYEEKKYGGEGKKIVGLSDCGCGVGFVPGVVLDLFAGAGTTGLVAQKQGKRSTLIEINPEYCEIIKKRLHLDENLGRWL